jgi:hypothetical protein
MVLEEFITTITFWMPVLLVYLLQSTSAITRKDPLFGRLLKFMRMNSALTIGKGHTIQPGNRILSKVRKVKYLGQTHCQNNL